MSDPRDRKFRAARQKTMREKNRIAKQNYHAIRDLLKQSSDRIRATLAAQPSDYQLWALPTLQREIQATLDSLGTTASTTAQAGWDDEWLAGQRTIDEPLRAAGITLRAPRISPRQLIAMREFLTDRIQDISRVAKRRINSDLGLIITGIQSPGEAISNVTRLLNETSRRRALTIVRTELGRAFSAAQSARLQQAKAHVPGLMKQWRRSGKLHARIQHDAADGQIRAPDQPFNVAGYKLMYPRDPAAPPGQTINCGCDSLPHMEHWDVEQPGRQPFTTDEIAREPRRANLGSSTPPTSPYGYDLWGDVTGEELEDIGAIELPEESDAEIDMIQHKNFPDYRPSKDLSHGTSDYYGNSYKDVSKEFAAYGKAESKKVRAIIKDIENDAKPLSNDYIVYRGISIDNRWENAFLNGEPDFAFWGPASTSTSPEEARGFAGGGALFQLKLPKGLPAITDNLNEKEITIPAGYGVKMHDYAGDVKIGGHRVEYFIKGEVVKIEKE